MGFTASRLVGPHRRDERDRRLAARRQGVEHRSAVGFFVDKAIDAQLAEVPGRGLHVQVQALGAGVQRQIGLVGQQLQQCDPVVVGKAPDDGFELFGLR